MDTLPLSSLRFGHDKAAPTGLNVRKSNRDEGIEALAATLLHYIEKIPGHSGLIENLTVVDGGNGAHFVADGNRRLAALHLLRDRGKVPADHPVPIAVEPLEHALSMSLTTAVTKLPLHPVDQYEAFADLSTTMSEADIAAAYAISAKQVKQVLALGKLSPKVRAAWRDGKLDAEAAQAFTLADPKRQDQVLAKLQKGMWGGRVSGYNVRREIAGGQEASRQLILFVGEETYVAAGGKVAKDLFGTADVVSDVALLKDLAEKKLLSACEQLIADGWSWAATDATLDFERWQARRLDVQPVLTKEESAERKRLESELAAMRKAWQDSDDEDEDYDEDREGEIEESIAAIDAAARARAFTAEQKASAGCIVSIDANGVLRVEAGLIKPGVRKPRDSSPKKAKAKAKDEAEPGISNALMQRLSEQLTSAVSACLKADPVVALPAVLAGFKANQFRAGDWMSHPICVSERGLDRKKERISSTKESSFAEAFKALGRLDSRKQLEILAEVAAAAVDMQTSHASRPPLGVKGDGDGTDNLALIAALKPAAVNKALRAAFDAKDYFGSVNKTLCLAAIREAINDDEARKAASKPKPELIKFCVANVPATGWLPPELRTVHYDGPSRSSRPAAGSAKKPALKQRPARRSSKSEGGSGSASRGGAKTPRSSRPKAGSAKKTTPARKPAKKKAPAKKPAKRAAKAKTRSRR